METLSSAIQVADLIFVIRGQRVMLDSDLAALYGVTTSNLNKAVRRNGDRFPADFMFLLTRQECQFLRFQIGTLRWGQHTKYLPHVFTEQGVAMLSSVLRSTRAVRVNIAIMRAFVRLRATLSLHKDLSVKMGELERRLGGHDEEIRSIFEAIKGLMASPRTRRRRIGFRPGPPSDPRGQDATGR